jgi:MFS family permease
MLRREFWTLNKALVAALIGAFAFLLLDIRYEHRNVLGEEAAAWIPILFSAACVLLGLAALRYWDRGGRKLLVVAFLVACLVGVAGVWFHTDGHPAAVFTVLAASLPNTPVFADSDEEDERAAPSRAGKDGEGENTPPLLAPLAFCGLGLFGLLACSRGLPSEP